MQASKRLQKTGRELDLAAWFVDRGYRHRVRTNNFPDTLCDFDARLLRRIEDGLVQDKNGEDRKQVRHRIGTTAEEASWCTICAPESVAEAQRKTLSGSLRTT